MSADKTTTDPVRSVPEIARHLGSSAGLVYRLIASGELRSFKVGRLVRVRESALEQFIRQQEG